MTAPKKHASFPAKPKTDAAQTPEVTVANATIDSGALQALNPLEVKADAPQADPNIVSTAKEYVSPLIEAPRLPQDVVDRRVAFLKLVEAYAKQNPVKYQAKKAELERKFNSII